MAKAIPGVRKLIYEEIMADLDPSPAVVHSKIALSIWIGGFLSLMLCGQFGVAFTPFADAMRGQLLDVMGVLGCTLTCGLIFSFLPVLILKAVTSPVQFYVLTRKKWPVVTGWMVVSGVVFIISRSQGGALDLLLWSIAATGTFFSFARVVHLISRVEWFSNSEFIA